MEVLVALHLLTPTILPASSSPFIMPDVNLGLSLPAYNHSNHTHTEATPNCNDHT